jgi:hypothetical protein
MCGREAGTTWSPLAFVKHWQNDAWQRQRQGESPMPNLLRNALAILAGIGIGGGVNMALITVSPSLIPPPA